MSNTNYRQKAVDLCRRWGKKTPFTQLQYPAAVKSKVYSWRRKFLPWSKITVNPSSCDAHNPSNTPLNVLRKMWRKKGIKQNSNLQQGEVKNPWKESERKKNTEPPLLRDPSIDSPKPRALDSRCGFSFAFFFFFFKNVRTPPCERLTSPHTPLSPHTHSALREWRYYSVLMALRKKWELLHILLNTVYYLFEGKSNALALCLVRERKTNKKRSDARAYFMFSSSLWCLYERFAHVQYSKLSVCVCVCPSQWPRGMPRMSACVTTPLFTPTAGVGEIRINFARALVCSRDCKGVSHIPTMFTPCSPFHVGFIQML